MACHTADWPASTCSSAETFGLVKYAAALLGDTLGIAWATILLSVGFRARIQRRWQHRGGHALPGVGRKAPGHAVVVDGDELHRDLAALVIIAGSDV